MEPFTDRAHAGRLLGKDLVSLRLSDPVVLALPRGGVPVAVEVARALGAPVDLLMVRKIGAPGHSELAVAAVVDAGGLPLVVDARTPRVSRAYIEAEAAREYKEIERRRALYLAGRRRVRLKGRTAVVVDDGIATGTSALAALQAVRRAGASRVVLAVPVGPPDTLARLRGEVDDLLCLWSDDDFHAVGAYYQDFHQLSDSEVIAWLEQAGPSDVRP